MKIFDIKNMKGGWFIGDFEPSIFKNKNVEVAHHFHQAGFKGIPHYHKETTEINYIVSGELIASGQHLKTGDFFVYEKNEIANVEFISDTNLIIVRYPSIPSDKYIVK